MVTGGVASKVGGQTMGAGRGQGKLECKQWKGKNREGTQWGRGAGQARGRGKGKQSFTTYF